jgi:hypothetical protein
MNGQYGEKEGFDILLRGIRIEWRVLPEVSETSAYS